MISTPLTFFATRFTLPEQLAIASSTVPEVQLYRMLFTMSERINSSDPRLGDGRQLLIATGLLTPERAEEVFQFNDIP